MALRLLARAAGKVLTANAANRSNGMLKMFSRGLLDDLSSLLDENLHKTAKSDGIPAKDAKQAKDLTSVHDSQAPKTMEAENVEAKPQVELLPPFASDEELIEYVTGIVMTTGWRRIHTRLAPLGDQVKAKHVPEILKRAQDSNLVFTFFKWAMARTYIRTQLDDSILQLMFVVLSCRENVNKPEEMQWLMEQMHAKGMKLENSMFVTVMQAYNNMKRMPDARRLFWKMDGLGCNPKTPTYNAILKILLDAGCNLDFDMVHSKLKFSGREYDKTTYEILLEKVTRSGKADDAYKLFGEMKAKFPPPARAYALLVQCLSAAGKEQLAMEIVEQMDQPGDDVYNIIVSNLMKSGKLGPALEEYRKMLEAGLRPYNSTCIPILTELVVTEKADQACVLFEEMRKAGYISPSDVVPVVYGSYKKCKVDIVFGFLKDICGKGCPLDADTIHHLAEGLVVRRRIDLGRRLFRSVLDAGKKPSVATYNLFIKHAGSVESAKTMFELMKNNKCKPDVSTYHWMIGALTNGGLFSEGFDLFTEMMDKGFEATPVTYKLVLELLGKDPTAGLDTIVETLKILRDKGRFQKAGEYLERLANDKLLPPKQTDTDGKILVKILQKDGQKFDDLYM